MFKEWLCQNRNWVLQNFPFLEDDFDALTDYELFCKMVEYAKSLAISNDKFVSELKSNLEIMYNEGKFDSFIEEIINLQAIFTFDTVADMKTATNLISGSNVITLGFYEVNDLGGAVYKIRELEENEIPDEIKVISINNNLVAELIIKDNMNIKQFGAKGDGIEDDTLKIQTAINNVKNLYIPETEDFYKITDTINLVSNLKIYGSGEKSCILMPNDLEETIFNMYNIKNITIENLKLCNESCQTGSSPDLSKNKIIYTDTVENLTIKNCYFENAFSRGIEIFKTKNFYYKNNNFKNATFDMLLLLPEVENAFIDNSIFDTITSTYMNTYLFATGRNDTETYDFSCRNLHVTNSKFLNNPNWEGIDSHGGVNIYIENNYVSNCKIGIIVNHGGTAPVTTDTIKHGNIYVKGNVIENSPVSQTFGIDIGVSGDSGFLCKNVFVENNCIDGYGSGSTVGALHLIGIKHLNVLNNSITNSSGSAMALTNILYADINGNKCINIFSDYGIHYIAGCWFINFKNNIVKNTSFTNTILWGIRSQLLNISQFENNDIVATNLYSSNGTIMNGTVNSTTNQIGKIGNYAKNVYGLITHYATNAVIRPAKTETLTSVSLSGNADSDIITGTNSLYYLTEGEEVILQGAGTAGVDLLTEIVEFINKDTFRVKDIVLTSFTNQNPKTNAGSWESV
jgi:hypothetical protein